MAHKHRELARKRLNAVVDRIDPQPEVLSCPVCKQTKGINVLPGGEHKCAGCGSLWWERAHVEVDETGPPEQV